MEDPLDALTGAHVDTAPVDRLVPASLAAPMATVTEHKCTDGWKPGKARNCEVCKAKQPFKVGQFVRNGSGPQHFHGG